MNLLQRHEKDCWRVDLMDDGTLILTSNYKRKKNIVHRIEANSTLSFAPWVPNYLLQMVVEMRYEWHLYHLRRI